jgi:hypothetical protein
MCGGNRAIVNSETGHRLVGGPAAWYFPPNTVGFRRCASLEPTLSKIRATKNEDEK